MEMEKEQHIWDTVKGKNWQCWKIICLERRTRGVQDAVQVEVWASGVEDSAIGRDKEQIWWAEQKQSVEWG